MKRLLVDIGNSTVARAWLESDFEPLGSQSIESPLLAGLPGRPAELWVSSVLGGQDTEALLAPLRTGGVRIVEVQVRKYPEVLTTRYHPDQLGVDRWLALLACRHQGLYPAVVVDAGTATTVDLLDHEGTHSGGYILPGLKMMRSALLAGTAIRLDETSPDDCRTDALPATTADAIHCGAIQVQTALIERLAGSLPVAGQVVLSGGMASAIAAHLRCRWMVMEHLVLRGLMVLAQGEGMCAG